MSEPKTRDTRVKRGVVLTPPGALLPFARMVPTSNRPAAPASISIPVAEKRGLWHIRIRLEMEP